MLLSLSVDCYSHLDTRVRLLPQDLWSSNSTRESTIEEYLHVLTGKITRFLDSFEYTNDCIHCSVFCPLQFEVDSSVTLPTRALLFRIRYMNIALEQAEEYVGGQMKKKYGDCFIRGNNGKFFFGFHIWCLVRYSSFFFSARVSVGVDLKAFTRI